jgi:hypothetical protein
LVRERYDKQRVEGLDLSQTAASSFRIFLGTELDQQVVYWVDGPTDVKIAVTDTSST